MVKSMKFNLIDNDEAFFFNENYKLGVKISKISEWVYPWLR